MPLQTEKHERIAKVLIKAVHTCDVGMRQRVLYYRNAKTMADAATAANRPADAARFTQESRRLLGEAARLPFRVEDRLEEAIRKHSLNTVRLAIERVSTIRLADMRAELAPLKIYSNELRRLRREGAGDEEIAVHIETNRLPLDVDEDVRWSDTYEDDF